MVVRGSLGWEAGWLPSHLRWLHPPWVVYFFPSLPFSCPSVAAGAGKLVCDGLGCCWCHPAWPLLSREMSPEDGVPARQRGQRVNEEVSGTPRLGGMPTPDSSRMEAKAEGWEPGPALGEGAVTPRGAPLQAGQREEALMTELSELVQKVVKSSSWWERHGVDISILVCSFLLLPAGNPAQHSPDHGRGRPRGVPLPPHGICTAGTTLCWEPMSSLLSP